MYYIVGKASYDKNGKFIDTNDMNLYWELGWELMSNYPIIKRMYKNGDIQDDDIIVTRKGLEFLYTDTFKNVISFDLFKKIPGFENHLDYYLNPNKITNNVKEIMPHGFNMRNNPAYHINNDAANGKYLFFEEDRDILTNIDLIDTTKLHNNEKFAIMCVRRRNHNNELAKRNQDEIFTIETLEYLKLKYKTIFILGNDCEVYESDNIKIINFQEYASLINNDNCDIVVSTLTAYYFLSLYISNAKSFIVVDFGDHNFINLRNDICGLANSFKYSNSCYKYIHHKNLNKNNDIFTIDSEI